MKADRPGKKGKAKQEHGKWRLTSQLSQGTVQSCATELGLLTAKEPILCALLFTHPPLISVSPWQGQL